MFNFGGTVRVLAEVCLLPHFLFLSHSEPFSGSLVPGCHSTIKWARPCPPVRCPHILMICLFCRSRQSPILPPLSVPTHTTRPNPNITSFLVPVSSTPFLHPC